jgi:ABC-type transport system involved in multi-copper enzyme maturation permease subunit
MTWLTWRQFRIQAVTAAAALAAFAILLAVTGPHLASLYAGSGITGCRGQSCGIRGDSFLGQVAASGVDPVVYVLGVAGIVFCPAVVGIFWGAPLIAREFEAGTFRLAWTQSVTRSRWLAVKLALIGLAAIAVTEGLSLIYAWWAAPISTAARLAANSSFPLGMGPFSLLAFDAHGITPIGYAAFAFTLGVTTGVLVRRTVPAMAITLAIFAAVQVAMPLSIRPHLFPPAHTTASVSSFSGQTHITGNGSFGFAVDFLPSRPGAWILSSGAVNAAGQPVSTNPPACKSALLSGSSAWPDCLTSHGIRVGVTYQPTSRYWAIQWIETAIYLALALALGWSCFWWLGRRAA